MGGRGHLHFQYEYFSKNSSILLKQIVESCVYDNFFFFFIFNAHSQNSEENAFRKFVDNYPKDFIYTYIFAHLRY